MKKYILHFCRSVFFLSHLNIIFPMLARITEAERRGRTDLGSSSSVSVLIMRRVFTKLSLNTSNSFNFTHPEILSCKMLIITKVSRLYHFNFPNHGRIAGECNVFIRKVGHPLVACAGYCSWKCFYLLIFRDQRTIQKIGWI